MKLTIQCLAIAIVLRLAFEVATGQTVEIKRSQNTVTRTTPVTSLFDYAHTYVMPGKIGLEWAFYDEARVWLEIKSADTKAWPDDGWHPSFTVILANYKPIVTQRGDKYEITFTQGEAKVMP